MFRQQCEYIIFSFLNLIVSSWALVVVLPNFVHNSDILCTVGGVTECHVVTIFPDTSSGLQRLSELYESYESKYSVKNKSFSYGLAHLRSHIFRTFDQILLITFIQTIHA